MMDGKELLSSQELKVASFQKFSRIAQIQMILPKEVLETATLLHPLLLYLSGQVELKSCLLQLRQTKSNFLVFIFTRMEYIRQFGLIIISLLNQRSTREVVDLSSQLLMETNFGWLLRRKHMLKLMVPI